MEKEIKKNYKNETEIQKDITKLEKLGYKRIADCYEVEIWKNGNIKFVLVRDF